MASPGYPPVTVFDAIKTYIFEAPAYHIALEAILISWILYLLFFSKQFRPASKHDKLTKEEEDELISEWKPAPLASEEFPNDREVDPSPVVTGTAGAHITVDGRECVNLATFNMLGFLENSKVKEEAAKSITKYGVGACGPRGFYGTVDIHLTLEGRLAKFTGREEAILYSYGFAAISSAIPAYSKKRDIIFCDEGVCFPIQKGLVASRSKVKYFRHNDVEHLAQLLHEQHLLDKKNPAKAKVTRKFIVLEAIYYNWGDMAPLPEMVSLRQKYQVPIILDESLSFGVLGKTGRGATEHFNLGPDDIDVMCASLETSLASVGGFCAGKRYIIDHQRLSGAGYCFSASTPPMMAAAAIEAINILENSSDRVHRLQRNAKTLRHMLKRCSGVEVCGDELSAIIHLRLTTPTSSREEDEQLLGRVASYCMEHGVAIVTAKYLSEEPFLPPASLRVTVTSELSEDDLEKSAQVIAGAMQECLTAHD